jgi:hypothetical protein
VAADQTQRDDLLRRAIAAVQNETWADRAVVRPRIAALLSGTQD